MQRPALEQPVPGNETPRGPDAYPVGINAQLTLKQRGVLLVLAAGVFIIGLWPTWYVRDVVLAAFAAPAYEGAWILLPHALLYSTLSALAAMVMWIWIARVGWLKPPSFAFNLSVASWGIVGGVAILAITVAALYALGYGGMFHAPDVDPWLMAGNAFSNLYEELIFRGFLLVALTAAIGFWPAAILSSIAFGAVHNQYPFDLQVLIGVAGFTWCIVALRAKSLLAPYISHMTLDWLIDPFL